MLVMRKSSIAASTSEPVARSRAVKRTRMLAVGNMKSRTRHEWSVQLLLLTATSASSVQVEPPLFDSSIGIESVLGAPPRLFEYQYQYSIVGSSRPARLITGESSVVVPPSTSTAPSAPPTTPLPVTQQTVPTAEWSFSGCAMVPAGSARTHMPETAVSPTTPPTQPSATSNSLDTITDCPTAESTVRLAVSNESSPAVLAISNL